jgi:hypothetical protein
MPLGMCVMRTADSVLFTCWPPAPEAAVHVGLEVGRVDLDLDVVVDLGRDEQRANEVWRRWSASNGDLRTSRCTPVSVLSQP